MTALANFFNLALVLLALLVAPSLQAQQSQRFGPYELHYSVVNTTFITPEVARSYGITRGKDKAIVNLAVREHLEQGTIARPMLLKGKTWDHIHTIDLEFKEVREGPAIYYIAEVEFVNEQWRWYEILFRPEGAEENYTHKFRHQLYAN